MLLIAECEDECTPTLPEGMAVTGLVLYAVGTVDDIVTAPGEAQRYNHRFQNVAIVPMIRRDSSGLMLTGRF